MVSPQIVFIYPLHQVFIVIIIILGKCEQIKTCNRYPSYIGWLILVLGDK